MATQSRDSNAFYHAQRNRKEMAGKVKMTGIPKKLVHETHATADRRGGSNGRIIALQTPAHGHFMLQTFCFMTFHDAHLATIPYTYGRRIWMILDEGLSRANCKGATLHTTYFVNCLSCVCI